MNDRHSARGGPRKDPRPQKAYVLPNWNRSVAVALIVVCISLAVNQPGWTMAEEQASGAGKPEETGIQVGSWVLTVPYCIGKSAFAIAGGTVGVLGYFFSGGNSQAAQSIWTTSIYGTYILRPAHLRGEEPIHFLGKADEDQLEPLFHPVRRAAVTSEPSKK